MESRWSGADPRSAGGGAGVYANNAPLRARGGAAVEQIVENYQDQFELILILDIDAANEGGFIVSLSTDRSLAQS